MRRNLIFVSILDSYGYSFHFGCKRDLFIVDYGILSNGLYILNVDNLSIDQRHLDINNVSNKCELLRALLCCGIKG